MTRNCRFWAALLPLAILTFPQCAAAKDEVEPPRPCPVAGKLRVADASSLDGIQSLNTCDGQIIVAPASPADYFPQPTIRISPERSPVIRTADSALADADTTRIVRIAPDTQEPFDVAALTPLGGAESILAMQPVSYRTRYDAMIGRVAQRHRIDPLLLHAVITQESRYHESATSPVGARGLMQLMPATGRALGVPTDALAQAETNVDAGARILRRLYERYGDFSLTLAAYNAGEGAVHKYGNQVPPYAETQNYVHAVMGTYQRLVAEQQLAAR